MWVDMGGCDGIGRTETWMWVDVKVLGGQKLGCRWMKVFGERKLGCGWIRRYWENGNLDVGGCESNGRTETWMWVDVKVLGERKLGCGWIRRYWENGNLDVGGCEGIGKKGT